MPRVAPGQSHVVSRPVTMEFVDDALMALIMRFVVDTGDDGLSREEFLRRQLKVLRRYLVKFPDEERGARALEWIGKHAARYRRDWELNKLADRTVYLRCADCPLTGIDAAEQCEIHEQWLYLLHRYLAGEAMTRDYVEDCLAVLREYKAKHADRLNVFSHVTAKAPKPKKGKGKKGKGKGKKGRKKKAKAKDDKDSKP